MKLPTGLILLVTFAAIVAGCETAAPRGPLEDPIAASIAQGDIVVEAVPFVRAPQTDDAAKPIYTNDAYARIQYLLPLPDGSGRLAFSDLRGLLYLTDESGAPPETYLDVRAHDVDFHNLAFPNETGLLGFAFHPQFGQRGKPGYGKLYTAFSAAPGSGRADYLDDDGQAHDSLIVEWTADDPAANEFSGVRREVLRVGQFGDYHNVGTIAFNPNAAEGSADFGLLYVGFGDGGGRNDPNDNGQNLLTPLGAIIRIDPLGSDAPSGRYGIPQDNPFVSRSDALPEIWAYGLRHPQQFSWDSDGRMFIIDIGQDQVEEINLGAAGGNYGWRLREGTFATAFGVDEGEPGLVYPRPDDDGQPLLYPVAQYDHDEGLAVSGGFVYRGAAVPELWGKYVFTDIVRGRVFYIDSAALASGAPSEVKELRIVIDGRERAFIDVAGHRNTYRNDGSRRVDLRLGIDSAGEIYFLTKGDGWIRKLAPLAAR